MEEVSVCKLCRLASYRSNAVAGEGRSNACIILVGEAPGANEDKEGRPFVGFAGRILDEALSNAGLDRSMLFITNVVKCRPPNNRRPRRDEIERCMDYLLRQISAIRPYIVCLLGATAHDTLIHSGRFKEHRGRFITMENRIYFTTYHPAAVAYNRALKRVFMNDIKMIAALASLLCTPYMGSIISIYDILYLRADVYC
jgi:uracil-DNA glycosylase family 4